MGIKYFAKNFPKLTTDIKPQIQEAQRTPNRKNNLTKAYHIQIAINQKFKGIQRKEIHYLWKNKSYRNLLIRNHINRGQWSDIFKVLNGSKTAT